MNRKLTSLKLVRKELGQGELEELPWPGLKAKDHLSRVVTRAVKRAREQRHQLLRAECQIAQLLDRVPAKTVLAMFFAEMSRRGRRIPRIAYNLIELF